MSLNKESNSSSVLVYSLYFDSFKQTDCSLLNRSNSLKLLFNSHEINSAKYHKTSLKASLS